MFIKKLKSKKTILILSLTVVLLMFVSVFFANKIIANDAKEYVSDSLNLLPSTKVGLLLGTSRLLSNGTPNAYFFNRIEAAVALFKSGKIQCIIVSGDNSSKSYDEPTDMKLELMQSGIPESAIYLDYAGLRTLDSVVRVREIFGQTSVIIISQKFHNERAVYIARKNNINAYGYNAKEVKAFKGLKTKIREYFARAKVFIDFLFGIEPKFLGEKVLIK